MRILLTSNSSWNIWNFRYGLVRALLAAGHEVLVVAPEDSKSAALIGLGCRHVPIRLQRGGTSPLGDLGLLARYVSIFASQRPDVILAYTIKPNVYANLAARLTRIRSISNISGLGTAFLRTSKMQSIVRLLYSASLQWPDCVFFQNRTDRDLFLQQGLVRRERVDILPGSGIDLRKFVDIGSVRQDCFFVFLFCGRLLRDKGLVEFVDAARMLRRSRHDVRFLVLGHLDPENSSGISKTTLDEWTAEGVIEWLGGVDDVRPHVQGADCVVLPSYREGTPRSLLEAAAMGKPLVATDVPGCREVVDDGVNGFLCRARDGRDLAAKMDTMMALDADTRARMGRAGRLKMEREFDEGLVIAKYMDAIESAVSKGAAKFKYLEGPAQ